MPRVKEMMDQECQDAFKGAKLALFIGARLLVIERDHKPGIAWPGYLDLPGGGRENGETAEACVLRETFEEVGLRLHEKDLIWRQRYDAPVPAWFFAAHLPEGAERGISFGDEGRDWQMMTPDAFVASKDVVPHFRQRVAAYLASSASRF